MHIIEVVLEGFKSYSERTVIAGWDPQFNCITGLNGSGKSNILDAICFVLGISTLSTVRAHSQQDLIYKRGQAGITRASVSIVFDNSDKEHSPAAYVDLPIVSVTRQVVVGGTSKYLIAGHRVQQNVVQQMFQEIQLNVNNPNFLIMQGQITKVVNMRSTEILGLIEEAAGTGVYQKERAKTIKELQNLDKPLQESESLLSEEVMPKLAQMRLKKTTYLEFQKSAHSIERLEQTVLVSQFHARAQALESLQTDREESELRVSVLNDTAAKLTQEQSSLELEVADLHTSLATTNLKKLDSQVLELSTKLTSAETELEIKNQTLNDQESEISKLRLSSSKLKQLAKPCEEQLAKEQTETKSLEKQLAALQKRVAESQEVLHGLKTGVSASGGQETGFAYAAKQAREAVAKNETQLFTLQAKQEQLQLQASKSVDNTKEVSKLESDLSSLQTELDAKKAWLSASQPEFDNANAKQQELQQTNDSLVEIQRQVRSLLNVFPGLEPPHLAGVISPVAGCFQIKEEHLDKQTALELCAGGSLWNLVVENEKVGSEVIRRAKKRVNVLPLNRMNAKPVSRDLIKKIDANNAWLALDLLSFDEKCLPAMAHVFGRTVICTTPALAQRASYQFKMRAITLRGDVYDPRGILSGGSRKKFVSQNVFDAAKQYTALSSQINAINLQKQTLQTAIETNAPFMNKFQTTNNEIPVLNYKRELVEKELAKLQHDSEATIALEAALEKIKLDKQHTETAIAEAKRDLAKAMADIEDMSTNRQGKLADLEQNLAREKKEESALIQRIAETSSASQNIRTKSAELNAEINSQERMLDELLKSQTSTTEQLAECTAVCTDLKRTISELETELRTERERTTLQSQKLKASEHRLFEIRSQLTANLCEAQELKNALETKLHSISKLEKALNSDIEEYSWLPGFYKSTLESDVDLIKHGEELENLKSSLAVEKKKLAQADFSFDSQIVTLVEQYETREKELLEHIATIKEDKIKIQQSMVILDSKRTDTINHVWQKVSRDFGTIFGDLLPNSGAELLPINNPLEEGFQIRVRLGATWKEGLTELSGGQRSLVALSLILALLQYHPAPVYILDEVDAALDANHTRNIGHIIKTRFQNAQFIIVSLKDDMFSNANRIFQTRFIDGKSTVSIVT